MAATAIDPRLPSMWVRGGGLAAGGFALVLLSAGQAGAQVTVTPRLTVSETYSDNVHLNPDASKRSDWITALEPGVDITQNSLRSHMDLSYTLQTYLYADNRNDSRVYHQLFANGKFVAVKNHLFVDASATRLQRATTLSGPLGLDNSTATGNITNVTTARVSPYLKFNMGSFAQSLVRVAHDRVNYDQGQADSYSNSASVDVNSGPSFRRLFWTANGSYKDVHSTAADDGESSRGALTLGYHLSYSLAPFVTGGYEKYSYTTTRSTTEGPFWEAGFRWTPSPRTYLEVAGGHRFYGRSYRLDLKHRRRLSLWHLAYRESLTSSRQLEFTTAGQVPVYDPNCPPDQAGCQPVDMLNLYDRQVVTSFFLDKEWSGDVTLDFTRRTSLTLGVFRLKRTLELNGNEETRYGVSADWNWDLNARSHVRLGGNWSRNEFGQPPRRDTLWSAQANYSRDLSKNARASLRYRHQSRSSDVQFAQYDENAVIASVSMSF